MLSPCLLLQAFFFATVYAAPAAICTQSPYNAYTALSTYPRAIGFCSSVTPVTSCPISIATTLSTITVTSGTFTTTYTTTTTIYVPSTVTVYASAMQANKRTMDQATTTSTLATPSALVARAPNPATALTSLMAQPAATQVTACSCLGLAIAPCLSSTVTRTFYITTTSYIPTDTTTTITETRPARDSVTVTTVITKPTPCCTV